MKNERASRNTVLLKAIVIINGKKINATIRNFSETGAMLMFLDDVEIKDNDAGIITKGDHHIPFTVTWVKLNKCGVVFSRKTAKEEFITQPKTTISKKISIENQRFRRPGLVNHEKA